MLRRASSLGPDSVAVLDRACDVLGRDLRALDALETFDAKDANAHPHATHATPANNRDLQVSVVVASLMHLAALEAAGVRATASLGLSLGEYVHIAHIGGIDHDDLLFLVDARGRTYDDGPTGKMVAVFPLDHATLVDVVREHGAGRIEIANLNSPTQHVIAGEHEAVDRVVAVLDRDHVVETKTIEGRIPMHTSRFEPVAHAFRPHLERVAFRPPRLAYRPNVSAEVLPTPSTGDFVRALTAHVHRPVLWRRAIETCVAEHPSVTFVEVGPGRILTNLLQKKWIGNRRAATDGHDDLRAGIAAIAELANG